MCSKALEYLENLQGLALFMDIDRGYNPSLREINNLSKEIRQDLEEAFKEKYIGILFEHYRRQFKIIRNLERAHLEHAKKNKEKYPLSKIKIDFAEMNELLNNPRPHSKFQDFLVYSYLDSISVEVLKAASDIGIGINQKPLLGSIHTEKFNACAISIPESNESIILYESQFFIIIGRFVKIIVQCFKDISPLDKDFRVSTDKQNILEIINGDELIKSQFKDLVLGFILEKNVRETKSYAIREANNAIGNILLEAIHFFVMGHEYGHIYMRHFDSCDIAQLQISNIMGHQMIPKWEEEFDADKIGFYISIQAMKNAGYKEEFSLIGASIFFSLCQLVDRAYCIKYNGHENFHELKGSHPPSSERINKIKTILNDQFNNEQLELALYLPTAIEEIVNLLWLEMKTELYDYYHSNSSN